MAEAYTISMSQGDHAEEHSRRSYTPMSADKSLEDRNVVIYDCGDDKEHFNEFFRPAIEGAVAAIPFEILPLEIVKFQTQNNKYILHVR